MLSSILLKQGYKTGLYTSPHLKSFNERYQTNGKQITDQQIDQLLAKIKPFYTDQSYFEVSVALAFLFFEDVDFLVLETGLGGRFDATNVIIPLVSIITSISLDHTQLLGETVEEIAHEKAGIIKEGIPIVTSTEDGALSVIKSVAKKRQSKVITIAEKHYPDFDISLKGTFQKENAALAIAAIDVLKNQGYAVSSASVREGLQSTQWSGRFEFVENNVVVDCAHNPQALQTLKKEIVALKYEKVIAVVGMLMDKDTKAMMQILETFADFFIFTLPNSARSADPKVLAKTTDIPSQVVPDPRKALKLAKKLASPDDLIVVTGSIYMVGDILK